MEVPGVRLVVVLFTIATQSRRGIVSHFGNGKTLTREAEALMAPTNGGANAGAKGESNWSLGTEYLVLGSNSCSFPFTGMTVTLWTA